MKGSADIHVSNDKYREGWERVFGKNRHDTVVARDFGKDGNVHDICHSIDAHGRVVSVEEENVVARKQYDWEAIEKAFRAGKLSLRVIADQYGCSEGAIRKKAKLAGWERDLSEKVAEKVRNELVRSEVRKDNPADEKEIIEQAAATQVQVIREHRTRIRTASVTVEKLNKQLEALAEEEADSQTLNRNSSTANNLANAMKTLVALERQAFGIEGGGTDGEVIEEIVRKIVRPN